MISRFNGSLPWSFLAFAGASFLLTAFALSNPIFTWDTVAYVATILSANLQNPVELHQATYTYLEAQLDAPQYAALINGHYASELRANADYFNSQLSMYMVKPLYVYAARALVFIGLEPILALQLLSLIPGLLFIWLVYFWAREYSSDLSAIAITLIFVIAARLIDTSRVPIPDNLSALFIVLSVYCLLVRNLLPVALACLILAVTVRTNNVIFAVMYITYISWASYLKNRTWQDKNTLISIASLIVVVAIYLLISIHYDQNWWRLFYHTFIESQLDIGAFNQSFDIKLYFITLKNSLEGILASGGYLLTALPYFVLLFLLSMRNEWTTTLHIIRNAKGHPTLTGFCLLGIAVILAFFFLFPAVESWDRFFIPFYSLFLIHAHQAFSLAKCNAAKNQ
jgi:hypothetical protein